MISRNEMEKTLGGHFVYGIGGDRGYIISGGGGRVERLEKW